MEPHNCCRAWSISISREESQLAEKVKSGVQDKRMACSNMYCCFYLPFILQLLGQVHGESNPIFMITLVDQGRKKSCCIMKKLTSYLLYLLAIKYLQQCSDITGQLYNYTLPSAAVPFTPPSLLPEHYCYRLEKRTEPWKHKKPVNI